MITAEDHMKHAKQNIDAIGKEVSRLLTGLRDELNRKSGALSMGYERLAEYAERLRQLELRRCQYSAEYRIAKDIAATREHEANES